MMKRVYTNLYILGDMKRRHAVFSENIYKADVHVTCHVWEKEGWDVDSVDWN
jgi:hypothetical protein